MAYLGNSLQAAYSSYLLIDSLSASFNGTTTSFALKVNGVTPVPFPLNEQNVLISVGGVPQKPDPTGAEGFKFSGTNIVFSSAPKTGEAFWGVVLAGADYVNVGVSYPDGTAATPSITFNTTKTTGLYLAGVSTLGFATAGILRSTIDSNGNLSVVSTGSATAPAVAVGTGTTYAPGIYSPGTDQLAISTSGSGRLLVDASGSLLIATTTNPTTGTVSRPPISLKQLNDSSAFSAIHIEANADQSLLGIGYNGFAFGFNTSYRGTGAYKDIFFATGNVERMRLDTSGRLGLGTSSPQGTIHVKHATDANIFFRNGTAAGLSTGTIAECFNDAITATTPFYLRATSFQFGTDSSGTFVPRVTVTSGGLVGIGTTSPGTYLSIAATATDPTGLEGSAAFSINSSATPKFQFGVGTSSIGYSAWIQNSVGSTNYPLAFQPRGGNVGIGTTSPGATLDVYGSTARFYSDGANTDVQIGRQGNGIYNPSLTMWTAYSSTNRSFVFTVDTNGAQIGYLSTLRFTDSSASYAERARIDSSGRLLIGTSSTLGGSSAFFQILGSAGSPTANATMLLARGSLPTSGDIIGYLSFNDNSGNAGAAINSTADANWTSGSSHPSRLVFSTTPSGSASPTERMRINNTGSVTLFGAASVASGTHSFQDNGSSPNTVRLYNTTDSNNTGNRFLICDAAASVLRAEIRSNGGLANYSANNANLSDRNAKKDISPAADTWNCLKEWKIVNYRYKDQPDDADLNLGVIAQQVAESCPEVITIFQEAKEATETEPAQEERLGVKEQQMYWMAIKALQEAMDRIETLEADVAALKGA